MKVSIITACFNSIATIEHTIQSVYNQDYQDIEHIVIDGESTDGTIDIVKEYQAKLGQFISEPDKGVYDAMNKGIKLASGEIIGFLNSDDFYTDNAVISDVVTTLKEEGVDAVYGNVTMVSKNNVNKVVRRFSSKKFHPGKFAYGYMPAHPTFFARRELYDKQGGFKSEYKISADFELLMRFMLKDNISCKYMDRDMVTMRLGGLTSSSLYNYYILNKEIIKACKENQVKTNYVKVLMKYFVKAKELF